MPREGARAGWSFVSHLKLNINHLDLLFSCRSHFFLCSRTRLIYCQHLDFGSDSGAIEELVSARGHSLAQYTSPTLASAVYTSDSGFGVCVFQRQPDMHRTDANIARPCWRLARMQKYSTSSSVGKCSCHRYRGLDQLCAEICRLLRTSDYASQSLARLTRCSETAAPNFIGVLSF